MGEGRVVAGAIAGLLVACALALWLKPARIERNLLERAHERLAAAGASWAQVTADGRDLTLLGRASPADAAAALRALSDLSGVRSVRDRSVPSTPAAAAAPSDAAGDAVAESAGAAGAPADAETEAAAFAGAEPGAGGRQSELRDGSAKPGGESR